MEGSYGNLKFSWFRVKNLERTVRRRAMQDALDDIVSFAKGGEPLPHSDTLSKICIGHPCWVPYDDITGHVDQTREGPDALKY